MSKIYKKLRYVIRCRTAERGQSVPTSWWPARRPICYRAQAADHAQRALRATQPRWNRKYVRWDTPVCTSRALRLGDLLVLGVTDTVSGGTLPFWGVEPNPNIGPAVEACLHRSKQHPMPAILVINKIEHHQKEELSAVIATIRGGACVRCVVPISARTGEGVEDAQPKSGQVCHCIGAAVPQDMVSDPSPSSACR